MKKTFIIFCFITFILNIQFISAQTASGFRGQSLSGATGLFSIPSGRIGWEDSSGFGFDAGYRAIMNDNEGVTHIPAITLSILRWIELSAAFDIQPEINNGGNNDLLFGFKLKLPTNNTSVVIGGNIQLLNIANDNYSYNAYQPYIAVTYSGSFFSMKAETTLVFGKTIYSGGPRNNSNIDFGMGFDLILFPDVFGDAVHWIIDFANFSYSDNSWPNHSYFHTSAVSRGILNTGFRIDLSAFPALNKFKFLVDFIFNDLFDDGSRSFTIGGVFGYQFS